MRQVRLHLREQAVWSQAQGLSLRGTCLREGVALGVQALAAALGGSRSASEAAAALRSFGGFFAVVAEGPDWTFVAVDRVRSLPLFYGRDDAGDVFVSDDARQVQRQVSGRLIDESAAGEFMLTGYTTAERTLSTAVKQLQAGELLAIDRRDAALPWRTHRYFTFDRRLDADDRRSDTDLLEQLREATATAMSRLVAHAAGRQLVVPLSGGYDSRLIATHLRKLAYPNLLAFTYGRPGNAEAAISRKVAAHLGQPWTFVPYSHEQWRAWYQSPEREAYFWRASQLSSLPHIQDWPAVWQLRQQGALRDDAIFVPGHTGDFISGGHTLRQFVGRERVDRAELLQAIVDKHYVLWPRDEVDGAEAMAGLVEASLAGVLEERMSGEEAIALHDRWDWQERQAKFIVNAIRAYEDWGFDWWMPLWDDSMFEFWASVPLRHRVGQALYKRYIDELDQQFSGGPVARHEEQGAGKVLLGLKRAVKRSPVSATAHALNRWLRRRHEYDSHPLAWYGLIPKEEFSRDFSGKEKINSFLARTMLEMVRADLAGAGTRP